MKISHYILLGFLFILLLFSTTTFINFKLAGEVATNSAYFTKSANIIRYSNRFQRNLLSMSDGLHGYLLTGQKSFIQSYDIADNENDDILDELAILLTDSTQKHLLKQIEQINVQWKKDFVDPLKTAKTLSTVSPQHLALFNEIYKKTISDGYEKSIQSSLKDKFKRFSTIEYKNRDIRRNNLASVVDRTKNTTLVLNAIALIVALTVVGFIVRKISKRIGQLTQKANQIALGNYDTDTPDTGKDELSSLYQSLNVMAAELSKNITLLTKSTEQLHKFTFTISRNLKSPINGIGSTISWIEQAHSNELTPKIAEYMQFIKKRSAVAENLIEELLSYSRTGNEVIKKESFDVNDLVNEVLENLPKANMIIDVGVLPVIYTERTLLFQVFSHLIGNAVKYNDKDDGMIKIYHQEHVKFYKFFIKDNGMGIPSESLEDIFLVREPGAGADHFQHKGLGLAIVKKIIDSKHQEIKVVSKPGEGSTFSFTWPKIRYESGK